jgi:hypothetical protein
MSPQLFSLRRFNCFSLDQLHPATRNRAIKGGRDVVSIDGGDCYGAELRVLVGSASTAQRMLTRKPCLLFLPPPPEQKLPLGIMEGGGQKNISADDRCLATHRVLGVSN